MANKRLVYILMLAIAIAFLALAVGATAQTPPPAVGSWYVSDDTSYSNTNIDLKDGSLYVYTGGNLTLTNVNLDFFTSGLPELWVYEGGSLNIQGGSITHTIGGPMYYPYRVVLEAPCTINGTRFDDLSNFFINSWGTSITNCTVTHSTYGMFYATPSATSSPSLGPIVIADNNVPISDRSGIGANIQDFSKERGRLVISGNYLWNVDDIGISVTALCDAADIIVEDNTLGSIGGDGIVLDLTVNNLKLRFDGNDVQDTDGDGARLQLDFDTLDFPGIEGLRSVNADQMCLRITLTNDFMDNVTFSGLDIQDGGLGGVSLTGVTNASIIDSSVDCPSCPDFVIARSTVDLFRTSHRQGSATVAYAISSITSWKTVELTCRWLNEEPLANRAVAIYSPDDGVFIGSSLTGDNGHIDEFIIDDWHKTSSESWVRTALRATASVNGNDVQATEPIVLDTDVVKVVYFGDFEVPVITITSPLGPIVQNTTDLLVTGTCSDNLSGPHSVQVSIDPEADWDKKAWLEVVGLEEWSITLTDLSEGNHTIFVRAWDRVNYPTALYARATIPGIVVDTTPPVFTFSYPVDIDQEIPLTNEMTQIVEGNFSEPVYHLAVLNAVNTVLDGTFVQLLVELEEGPNHVSCMGRDLAGNDGTFEFTIVQDITPPSITIDTPGMGTIQNTDSVVIGGTVGEDLVGGQVFIGGTAVTLNGNTFEHLVLGLEEGENTITVSGVDLAGNPGQASVTVTVDTVAPVVTITAPANGLRTNVDTVTVEGTVSESWTVVTVNGATATVNKWDFTIVYDLQEGDNYIVVTAVDAAGHSGEASVAVTLDTVPPDLQLHGLDNGTLTTKGDTQDVTGSTDRDATLVMVVGGVEMTVAVGADGTFHHTITVTDVETLVTVRASDLVGNTASEDVLILQKRAADVPDEAPMLTPEQTTAVALTTTSVIIAGALVSIEFTKYSLVLLFLPLYARLKKDAVLDNKTRLALHGLVVENPGMHYNEIIREFGLTNGVAAYHLDVLEREGFVRSVRDGTKRRFYSTTTKVPDDTRLTPDETREHILQLINDRPGVSQKEIVDELGLGRTLVGYHLKTLVDEGYIKASRRGRFTVYSRTQKRWFQMT